MLCSHFGLFSSDVTKIGFVGCIEDVALQVITWDLNENKQSKGVIPGCPDQVLGFITLISETEFEA